MKDIITSTSLLHKEATQLQFLDEASYDVKEGNEIIAAIKEAMGADDAILALSAPQIGYDKSVFCLRFADGIKTFINPIIKKKEKYEISPETFSSMPGCEILISRPSSLEAVYWTEADGTKYKYEDNKFLGGAAKLFDQMCQALEGVTPDDIGLVSNIEESGSFSELSDDEVAQAVEIYKQYVSTKAAAMKSEIEKDDEAKKGYRMLKFTEDVITGNTVVVENPPEPKLNRAGRRAQKKRGGRR